MDLRRCPNAKLLMWPGYRLVRRVKYLRLPTKYRSSKNPFYLVSSGLEPSNPLVDNDRDHPQVLGALDRAKLKILTFSHHERSFGGTAYQIFFLLFSGLFH